MSETVRVHVYKKHLDKGISPVVKVLARVGPFVMHKSVTDDWRGQISVTHEATGRSVYHTRDLKDARAVAKRLLACGVDWSKKRMSAIRKEGLPAVRLLEAAYRERGMDVEFKNYKVKY